MAKLHINIGDTANDRTGDPLRTAFDKVNQNFDELYARTGDDIQIPALAGNNGKVLTVSAGALSWGETTSNDRLVNGDNSVILDSSGVLTLPGTGTISNSSSASSTGTIYTFSNDGISTPGINSDTVVYLENNANSQAIQSGWIITFADATQKTVLVSDTGMPPHAGQRMLTFSGAITKVGEDIWPLTVQSADYGTSTAINLELTPDGTTTWTFSSDGFTTFPGGIKFDNGRDIYNPTNNGVNIWDGPYTGPYNGEILLDSNGVIIFTDNENNWWQFKNDGTLEVPGGNSTTSGAIQQRTTRTVTQGYTTVEAGSTGIIYSAGAWQTGFKLTIMVESRLDDNTDDIDHTQVCEVLIAANYNSNVEPVMSVYGITYTSPSPLATFEVQRSGDMSSGTIEVVATNVQAQYNLTVSVHAVQFSSVYD